MTFKKSPDASRITPFTKVGPRPGPKIQKSNSGIYLGHYLTKIVVNIDDCFYWIYLKSSVRWRRDRVKV